MNASKNALNRNLEYAKKYEMGIEINNNRIVVKNASFKERKNDVKSTFENIFSIINTLT
jgi:hypothetical protein